MFSITRLIDVPAGHLVRVADSLQKLTADCGAHHAVVAPTLAGSRNGGDLLMHLRFEQRDDWEAAAAEVETALTDPAITRVNGVDYHGAPTVMAGRSPGRVYRTLLLRVEADTGADLVDKFEADLRALPRYVSSISAWQLSRPAHTVGATEWTHVFEQEFSDADGIMGPYLMHPFHWAVVDRWFDPECPDSIVRARVCHSFCECPPTVLR
jgi:Stress responsive A/B Barrel Domain